MLTPAQAVNRMMRCQELLQEIAIRMEREFYNDPSTYGDQLPHSIRRAAAKAARVARERTISRMLAELTTSN